MDVTQEEYTELIFKLMMKKLISFQKKAIFVKLVSVEKCKLV